MKNIRASPAKEGFESVSNRYREDAWVDNDSTKTFEPLGRVGMLSLGWPFVRCHVCFGDLSHRLGAFRGTFMSLDPENDAIVRQYVQRVSELSKTKQHLLMCQSGQAQQQSYRW